MYVYSTVAEYEAADAAEVARYLAAHDGDDGGLFDHMLSWEHENIKPDIFADNTVLVCEPPEDSPIPSLIFYARQAGLHDLACEYEAIEEAYRVAQIASDKDDERRARIEADARVKFLKEYPNWEADKDKLWEAGDYAGYDKAPDLDAYIERRLAHNPQQPRELHLTRRFVFVRAAGAFWDLMQWQMVPMKTVQTMLRKYMPKEYMGAAGGMAVYLMDTCKPVDRLSYAPDKPHEYTDDNMLKCFNVYRPSSLVPMCSDATPWLVHVYHLFGDDVEAIEHFLDWLSYKTQHPGRKIRHAVVIHGAQGIGKDTLAKPLFEIFGGNIVAPDNDEAMKGKTLFLENKTLILIQELKSGDNFGLYDRLKPIVTETSVRVEPKFINPYSIECPAAILAFTNHENCLRLEDGDRRWWLYSSKMTKREPAYYASLYDWYEAGGTSHVASYLLNRDVSKFNPDAHPPQTAFKERVLESSKGEIRNALAEMWEDHKGPFAKTFVNVRDALRFLRAGDFPKLGEEQLKAFLRQKGAQPFSPYDAAEKIAPTRYKRNGQPVLARLWLLRGKPAEWKGASQEHLGDAVWHSPAD